MSQPLYPNAPKGEQHWFQYDTQSRKTNTTPERKRPQRRGPNADLKHDAPGFQQESTMRDAAERHNIGTYYGKCNQCGITAVAYSHADLIKRLKVKHMNAKKRSESE